MRSGFATVIGRPNVGKSTLVNTMVGTKVSITSPRPNTTRFRVRGVLTRPGVQVVFVDTPGLHRPRTALGKRLNQSAGASLDDVDVIVALVDATAAVGPGDRMVLERAVGAMRRFVDPPPLLVAVNKTDLARPEQIMERLATVAAAVEALVPPPSGQVEAAAPAAVVAPDGAEGPGPPAGRGEGDEDGGPGGSPSAAPGDGAPHDGAPHDDHLPDGEDDKVGAGHETSAPATPGGRRPFDIEYFPVSAETGEGVDALIEAIVGRLPEGPAYYPDDMVSDTPEAVRVAELVREQLLIRARDELPHSIACRVTEWEGSYIRCEILVERDSQKGIVIGVGGEVLKAVGSAVRAELAPGTFLDLFVRVEKRWQQRAEALDRLGY